MMAGLRRVVRLIGTIVFSLCIYVVAWVIKLFTLGNSDAYFRWICRGARVWGYGMAWIWGMRIRVSGPRPKAPFFLVSNHISYTDIILVCAVCPAWFISKSEVAKWPGVGPFTRVGPTIYIDRELRRDVKRMNHLIAHLVVDGAAVGFFPEGTTTDGEEVLPFKPSLFQPTIEMKLPVSTAAIAYETRKGMPAASKVVAWFGEMSFMPHVIHLLGQPGFTAHIRFGEQTLVSGDRKELARLAQAQVCQDLERLKEEFAV
ncbi:1-acyl-sn-glycerol-3-phosphate acyltransferase [Kiritimatiellota bacterium B12222]|nr:1-acyl-sn-glycerol-3-phosphate acyltransferase [Kiritimatiellota bacterium B12222]